MFNRFSKTFTHSLVAILQFSLVTSAGFSGPSPTPTVTPPDTTNWKETCAVVKSKEKTLEAYTTPECRQRQKCREESLAKIGENYGQVGPLCKAAELAGKGKAMEIVSVSVFAAAAAVCLYACVAEKFGVTAAAKTACTGAGGAATAIDLGMTIGLTVQKMHFGEFYQTKKLGKDGNVDENAAKGKDGKTYTGLQAGGIIAGGAATAASGLIQNGVGHTFTVMKHKLNTGSCVAGALLGVAAALKGVSIKSAKNVEKAATAQLGKLATDLQTKLIAESNKAPPTANAAYAGIGSGGSGDSATPETSTDNPLAGSGNEFLENQSPMVQQAATGSLGDFLKNLSPAGKNKEVLDKIGFNPEKFASSLNSGMSPSSAMAASAPGLSPELIQEMKEYDDMAARGEIAMNGVDGTAYAALAASVPAAAAPAEAGFIPEEAAPAAGGELGFDRGPANDGIDPNDIWHTNFQGSIFEIVSKRIELTKAGIK